MLLSLNEIRNRAISFAKEWERDYSEDAEAKSFWDGFFDIFGVPRRRVATFEFPVKKIDGSDGYIDVFWKGVLLAEHKSKGKSLDKAFKQAKEYFPGLKNEELPKYIIVSDFSKMRLIDLETGEEKEFLLKDLYKNIDLFDFISGYSSYKNYAEEEQASIKAARLMADFHNEIEKTGYDKHSLEVFLIRILFCLFADDTGIFNKSLFRGYIENRLNKDGSDLGIHLGQIFYTLNTPVNKRQTNIDEQLMSFPYINGGIFSEQLPPITLDTTAYLRLLKCCEFDWSNISASIFGSLFQGVMDKKERRQLGAHYTSETNILKLIKPLFLDELYIEFDQSKYDTRSINSFHKKLSELRFLDPACGCGNFLVTAYRELRRLELEVLKNLRKDQKRVLFGAEDISKIQVNQFYGIEVEEFPALVARTAMYLVDHQMNMELSQEFGQAYARIPLREPATIVNADALIIDWEEVVSKDKLSYILGNPPFVGAQIMKREQKEILLKVFNKEKGVGDLDFVTAWYEKAAKYIFGTQIKTAFVSTNSICQGEQVGILWKRLKEKYGIFIHFAHQTFKWNNDAPGVAAVQCVIVGFANFDTPKKYLFEYKDIKSEPKEKETEDINGYLVSAKDVFIEKRTKQISSAPNIIKGNYYAKSEGLIIEEEDLDYLITNEPNVKKYVKLLIGADEFINNKKRYCLWLVDCPPDELRKMPFVMERVNRVKEDRLKSTDKGIRNLTPTRFRETNNPDSALVIPVVSSEKRRYIPMGFIDKNTISTNGNLIIPNAGIYHFGILESFMHMTWVSFTCGRLKSDYRYSKDIVYNNFPWPENVTDEQKKKVEESAQKVLDVRSQFLNSSLADLYDPNTMPPELLKAHDELDRAVDTCYGRRFTSKEDRIEFLFELYKKYTKQKSA
ncbi:MAG: class I SAM-dependent DNA methyltransferase [Candidatus Pacebacteria bacterium]|nr:class I SAM-dependent DNA methyltransferase [Candidatus Paceibacterota bacterium]